MSDLSNIRSLKELEYQRAILQLKAANQERKIRQDVEDIKDTTFRPVTNVISSIRTGVSTLKLVAPIALPILRFFWSRRSKRKR